VTIVAFCTDPLAPRRPDPHFAREADAVMSLGGTVALIDHDALLAGRVDEAVRRIPPGLGPVWYRGWMIPSDIYGVLADTLAERGSPLRVSGLDYRNAHEFPGWYRGFETLTPRSEWTSGSAIEDVGALVRTLSLGAGPAVVKDFVKSRKHEWNEACFIPDLADRPAAERVVTRFIELQADSLQGGLVVRVFEDLGPEARVWWLDLEPVLLTAHPDTPGELPQPDLAKIQPAVRHLGCRFVTTDVAQRADGAWRVIEVGDGQVSDLPADVDPASLFRPLLVAR
jgi:ATP-grasp domain-containing protein